MSDIALVTRLKRGNDPTANDDLVTKYGDKLYGYLYYLTSEQRQSEQLLEATLLQAVQHIHHYRTVEQPFSTWLYHIAAMLVRSTYRVRKPVQQVHNPLTRLSLEQRQIIVLRVLRWKVGMDIDEIAYVLAKPVTVVKQLQREALHALGR
jgi:DNA-directed RNA polymerase specialized sigma24 family protein